MSRALSANRVIADLIVCLEQVLLADALGVSQNAVISPVVLVDIRGANDPISGEAGSAALKSLEADHLDLAISVQRELQILGVVG